jgi:hypothetical protein
MASVKERAWLAAHQKGSKALIAKLDKAHANNPEYQAFKQKHGLGDTSSVKQVSKSQVDAKKEKARQVLAGKAYGATKGTRMGSAEGTGETLRDTIAPLTRDQHSAVKAAEREAKAAEKPAKPVKAPKPKKERAAAPAPGAAAPAPGAAAPAPEKKKPTALELIAAAAAKRKLNQPPVSAKALRRIAAVGDMEHDHGGFEDLDDTQYGGRRSYNEEVKLKVGQRVKFKEPVSGTARHSRKPMSFDGGKVVQVTPTHAIVRPQAWHGDEGLDVHVPHKNIKEENKKRQVEPPPEAMASDTRIKPLPKKGKRTTGSFNKFGNFTPGMKEEVEQVDEVSAGKKLGAVAARLGRAAIASAAHVVTTPVAALAGFPGNNVVRKVGEKGMEVHRKTGSAAVDNLKKGIKNLKSALPEETEQVDENDYSRRRRKEEDIISGKKPERKKIPMGSDYAARRRKERLANNGRMDEANYVATADSNPDMLAASRYGTTTTQAPKGTEKDYQKLLKRQIKNRIGLHRKPNLPEEVEQIDEMKYGIGAVVKLKKPVDGHGYATVKGFTSSGSTSGPTGRGVPMPAGKVKKVKVALRKNDDHSYYAGPVTHIQHDDVHSVIRESAPGWMLRQNPELAKKVKARIAIAKNRKKQMGNPEPVKEAKKHRMGGALFADTAARLQKAINAHKERMDQMTNGPEHEYHHPTLNIRTKSRLTFPAPWVKVEDK